MLYINKKFIYEGNNLDFIAETFPDRMQQELKVQIPLYHYDLITERPIRSGITARTKTGEREVQFVQNLSNKNYRYVFDTDDITGSDPTSFLQYYANLLLFAATLSHESIKLSLEDFTIQINLSSENGLLNEFKLIPVFAIPRDTEINNLFDFININEDIFINNNMVLANAAAFKTISGNTFRKQSLLILYAHYSLEISEKKKIRFIILNENELKKIFHSLSDEEFNWLKNISQNDLDKLLEFTILFPELQLVHANGHIKFIWKNDIKASDIYFYDLFLLYKEKDATNRITTNRQFKYNWNDAAPDFFSNRTAFFDFSKQGIIIDHQKTDLLNFIVKGFDGAKLANVTITIPPNREVNAELEVVVYQPQVIGENTDSKAGTNDLLLMKGKVFNPEGKCKSKNLTVALQVKYNENNLNWTTIAVATTEDCGNFVLTYPKGVFTAAQAIVLEEPDAFTDLKIIGDDIHVKKNETLVNEFIFLLIPVNANVATEHTADDCSCGDDSNTPRLPNHKDFINSGKYSQDLGTGGCVNLTTPNRTLSEQNYYALVRTSEPDVANYIITKNNYEESDGFQKIEFTLSKGNLIDRKEVTLDNPIQWFDFTDNRKDDDIIYQAVSIATGHILRYKSELKADGYSLGDLLYSLPLAPGQKKQIVVYDLEHTLEGSETQKLTQREGLNASVLSDRSIISSLDGSIQESLSGQSNVNTHSKSGGIGGGGLFGTMGAVIGISGGFSTGSSSASSSASQSGSRATSQDFSESLRSSTMQTASSFRELNATVIHTAKEDQQYRAATEVISNHNHCHSLTMLYFEVLRHYAVYQELVQVEECLFVPLIMTNFTQEKIRKWRDVLASNLMPRPSNTYFSLFRAVNPLAAAFDANERVLTKWANVDFPTGRYCDEQILDVQGSMSIRVNLPRPKTRYDRIFSLPITNDLNNIFKAFFAGFNPAVREQIFDQFITIDANFQSVPPANSIRIKSFRPQSKIIEGETYTFSGPDFFGGGTIDKQQWESYAKILGKSDVYELLDYYFANKLISEWDTIFYNDLAPMVYKEMIKSLVIKLFKIDLTTEGSYSGGERLMNLSLQGSVSIPRKDLPEHLNFYSNSSNINALKSIVTFNLESLRLTYQTAHFKGILYSGRPINNILDSVDLYIPLTAEEKRNPRKEDKFIVNELITHLNSNLEYYNKVMMSSLSVDKRQLLLDGFLIQVYNNQGQPTVQRSLASVVKNQLIGIVGNAMVFPVASGVRVDRSFIVEEEDMNPDMADALFNHYKPLTPTPPYRISVPTRGVFSEALMGACDSCEAVKDNTSQDWDKFKTDEPTPIGPVTVSTPEVTDWKAAFKDFATPIVNIQNAPAMPEPGTGLQSLKDLLGKSDIFNDVTGLTENQKNALATYLSSQENAKAFATMAKEMAMQSHTTANSDKIKKAIDEGEKTGKLSKDDAGELHKDLVKQMIDGGASAKAEREKVMVPSSTITDSATQAMKGMSGITEVKATSNLPSGRVESVEVKGSGYAGFKEGEGLISSNARNFRSGTELDKYLKNEQPKDKNNYRPQTGNQTIGNIEPFKVGFKNPRYCNIMYIAGDNNLSSLVYDDLLEMQNASNDGNFTSLVLFDLVDNTGMYVIEINNNRISLLERWTVNLDNDLEALTVFLVRAIATYDSAAFQMAGFWGHGTTSFMRKDPELELRDLPILPDDNTGARKNKSILLNQLRNALGQAMALNQRIRKFDLVYFDACLLQTVEMGSEMQHYAEYMVASQDLVPGNGYNYETAINAILTLKPSTGDAIGKILVDAYKSNYADEAGGDKKQTLSLVDLSKIDKLEDAMKNLIAELLTFSDTNFKLLADDLYIAVQKTLQFPFYDYPAYTTFPVQCTIDLVSLLNNYKEELTASGNITPEVKSKLDAALSAATSCVLVSFADLDVDAHVSPNPVASGISVWFPKRDVYVNELKTDLSIKRKYTQLEAIHNMNDLNDPAKTFYPQIGFVKKANWMGLINKYILAEYF